eukprot:7875805-Pyramimonas_sp.AAC.1
MAPRACPHKGLEWTFGTFGNRASQEAPRGPKMPPKRPLETPKRPPRQNQEALRRPPDSQQSSEDPNSRRHWP